MITKQQIEQWNKEFTEATPEEQRVLVAKDVILQINEGKYLAKKGTYLYINGVYSSDSQVQSHIDEITCNCCALGGMLMSCIKYQNNVTFKEAENESLEQIEALNIFTNKQKILIEAAFEGWYIEDDDYQEEYELPDGIYSGRQLTEFDITFDEYNIAGEFCNQTISSNDKLFIIMENIVKNNGEFKP